MMVAAVSASAGSVAVGGRGVGVGEGAFRSPSYPGSGDSAGATVHASGATDGIETVCAPIPGDNISPQPKTKTPNQANLIETTPVQSAVRVRRSKDVAPMVRRLREEGILTTTERTCRICPVLDDYFMTKTSGAHRRAPFAWMRRVPDPLGNGRDRRERPHLSTVLVCGKETRLTSQISKRAHQTNRIETGHSSTKG